MAGSLLVFATFVQGLLAWTPQPKRWDIPLKTPEPKPLGIWPGKKTQVSLYPPNGPVAVLAGADVADMNSSKGAHAGHPVVVAMYASWCPHCWHLVPSWVELAMAFGNKKDIEIAAINCADAANRDTCDKAGVSGFPDIQCYGCPVSSLCPRNGCVVTVGFETQGESIPQWTAEWISNATKGAVKPSHPELLNVVQPGAHHVLVEGPPGKAGFIPNMYTPAAKRNTDAMRGFLSALWSKNDAGVALKAVKFMVSLMGPPCCKSGGMPNSMRTATILQLPSLQSLLEGKKVDTRDVLEKYASKHGINDIGNQERFATYKKNVFAAGGKDSFQTCGTYTCSLWTFLHLTTTSSAYFAAAGSPRLSPGKVMNFTRFFVSEFLTCSACRHHFLLSYDKCEFQRCDVDEKDDWAAMVMWLWRVHQGVSLRTAAASNAPVDRRWPSYEDCPGCWRPLNFQDKKNANDFDIQKIGDHSAQIDAPFNLGNTYQFLVAAYVGWDSTGLKVMGDKVSRLWGSEPAFRTLGKASDSWLWCTFSGVAVAGAVAAVSLGRRSRHQHQSEADADLTDVETLSACE